MVKKRNQDEVIIRLKANTPEGKWWLAQNDRDFSMTVLVSLAKQIYGGNNDLQRQIIDQQVAATVQRFGSNNQSIEIPVETKSTPIVKEKETKSKQTVAKKPASNKPANTEQTSSNKNQPLHNTDISGNLGSALFDNDEPAEKPSNENSPSSYRDLMG